MSLVAVLLIAQPVLTGRCIWLASKLSSQLEQETIQRCIVYVYSTLNMLHYYVHSQFKPLNCHSVCAMGSQWTDFLLYVENIPLHLTVSFFQSIIPVTFLAITWLDYWVFTIHTCILYMLGFLEHIYCTCNCIGSIDLWYLLLVSCTCHIIMWFVIVFRCLEPTLSGLQSGQHMIVRAMSAKAVY